MTVKFIPFFYSVNFKKNEKIYNSANSEVYKMLQEAENDPSEPGNEADKGKYHYTNYSMLLSMMVHLNGNRVFSDSYLED